MNVTIDKDRLAEVNAWTLKAGGHSGPDDGACLLEAVSYVAGEPWSDKPVCASPIIAAFGRRWNDDLDNDGRQKLAPYIPRLVGTRSTPEVEERRGWMAADWLIRVHTPAWLELAGCKEASAALRSLPELVDAESLDGAMPAIEGGRKAGAAARAAAWDAAWAAAWDAAWAAARAAAWDAARAAAWDAAWDAARAAAWDAARAALEPTQVELQASAFELLDRMIALSEEPSDV